MMPARILALLGRHWHLALIGLLIAALGVQTWRADRSERRAKAEEVVHTLTKDRMEQASRAAARLAAENKLRKETADDTARRQADADLEPLRARYRAAILRAKAAPVNSSAGKPDLPGTSQAAQGADGPGAGAGVPFGSMIVTHDDALICADNTARLQAARDWALKVSQP